MGVGSENMDTRKSSTIVKKPSKAVDLNQSSIKEKSQNNSIFAEKEARLLYQKDGVSKQYEGRGLNESKFSKKKNLPTGHGSKVSQYQSSHRDKQSKNNHNNISGPLSKGD